MQPQWVSPCFPVSLATLPLMKQTILMIPEYLSQRAADDDSPGMQLSNGPTQS